MTSYNNHYGNVICSVFGGTISELIMEIVMFDMQVLQNWRQNIEQCFIMVQSQENITHCTHNGNKSQYLIRQLHEINMVSFDYYLVNCLFQ